MELLFWGGIIITVCTVILAAIYFTLSHLRWIRMNAQMDEEYGKKEK